MGCAYCVRDDDGKVKPLAYKQEAKAWINPTAKQVESEQDGMVLRYQITYCPKCGDLVGRTSGPRREFIRVKSYNTAKNRVQWARRIATVDGGFLAFESVEDYLSWKGKDRGRKELD